MTEEKLIMTFDPNTIEHLGVRMYSTLPPVLAELVANSHDADASRVEIILRDEDGVKEISVKDDGVGMSFEEINQKFLRIGRNRRSEEASQKTPGGRKIIGKKGLGKLAFFGVAHEIEIATKKGGKENIFKMDWDSIKEEKHEYSPKIIKKDSECHKDETGTTITLRKIQRESDFDADSIATSISKIFIIDPGFEILVKHNSSDPLIVKNERKYADLEKEIEWDFPKDVAFKSNYDQKGQITGHLIATRKPISPKTNMRGIVLFSRKKLVNAPEYFSDSTSSHFFSYLTGWLEIDFIDDLDDDVISTNRQSLNWGHPEMQTLRGYLQGMIRWLEQDWRKKRAELRTKKLEQKIGLKISEWREHIPENINKDLDSIVSSLIKESELSEEKTVDSLKGLQNIIKPYPYFHWRNLNSDLQNVVFDYYKNEDYYTAVFEGAKKYVNSLKTKSGETLTDRNLIEKVFSLSDPTLSVTKKYKKPSGDNFEDDTVKNITEGHRMLALAMWQAFRSPIAHEEVQDLKDSGLFTEGDCLDALSLLSHLFNRLDNSETP